MAASEKVFVCGRCGDYGAPNLEELVTHMTNCGVPEIRKKGENNQYEDNQSEILFDDSENSNSDGAIEYADISEEKESTQKEKYLGGSLIPSQPGYPHVIDTGSTSPSPFLWSKKTALILLNLLKSHKEDMESPYIRRKTVWQKIALEMQRKYGYCVTSAQCENKFKNMSNRYRKARDNNLRREGSMKQTCFLYNELDEYYRSDARYQPRRDSMFDSKGKPPKIIITSKYIDSDRNYAEKELINISESETSNNCKKSTENEAEPIWVSRMMETFERCHRENMVVQRESMKMQREFIDVLKKILEKK